ncbi:type II secretion system F family protein [Thermanaeromonas toyohensis]|nr:hypothetical protein [Thermanaeromonas toyohensis]
MRESIFSVSNLPYLILLGLCSACGLWFGIFYLRNPLAGIILAAGGVVFPEQVRRLRRRARREKVIEQLGAAVRVFSAEYSDTPHPVKALAATAAKLPDPVGGILRRTVSGLTAARNSEDVDVALINMGRELGGEYGKMFAQLVRLSFEDEAVKPLFSRLAARITAQQDLVRKNRLEISVDRALALILNLAVVPVYFIVVRTVPEASEFFHATAAGKGVIALCLFSAVVGSLLDIVIGGVDDG